MAPTMNGETTWTTPDGKSFYVWGGGLSNVDLDRTPPPVELWKFASDGKGGGLWTQENVSDPTFSKLQRSGSACGIAVGDSGYLVGGYVTLFTDASASGSQNSGMTSFNSSSGAWNYEATLPLSDFGNLFYASAVTIPASNLDDRGLLFVLGGLSVNPDPTQQSDVASFNNITMYDPYIDAWFSQHATGDVPTPRENFCAVAVKGDNGTYEM